MSVLEKVDAFVLDDGYQHLNDWLNDTFGTTNYLLALICSGSFCLLHAARETIDGGFTVEDGALTAVFFAVLVLQSLFLLPLHRKAKESTVTSATDNPYREVLKVWRYFFLLVGIPIAVLGFMFDDVAQEILRWLELAQDFAGISIVFFVSCRVIPPKPRESWQTSSAPQSM